MEIREIRDEGGYIAPILSILYIDVTFLDKD